VRTLAAEGYAHTTARAIAHTGGFASGVIYYHFTDLDDLFAAAAQFTSQARLSRYRAQVEGVTSAVELVRRLRRLHAEDRAEGHIAAVQQLFAAATTGTAIIRPVTARPATALPATDRSVTDRRPGQARGADQRGSRPVAGLRRDRYPRHGLQHPFAAFIPVRELATAIVAAYLGLELLPQPDDGDTGPDALFGAAEQCVRPLRRDPPELTRPAEQSSLWKRGQPLVRSAASPRRSLLPLTPGLPKRLS
jgi:AcrR family transcriptional regulator